MGKSNKNGKKGCGCVGMFLSVMVVLTLIGIWTEPDVYDDRSQWPAFFEPYDSAQTYLDTGAYLDALAAADKAVAVALTDSTLDVGYIAEAYLLKAEAYLQLWQYIDAEETLSKGLLYANENTKPTLTRMLAEVQGLITDNDTERGEQHIYHASPGIGPGHTLHGKVVIAYVFVDDGEQSTWSLKSRQIVLMHLQQARQWIEGQARRYGITGLTFVNRVFQYDKDPWLRNALPEIRIDENETGYDLALRVAALKGARRVNDFLYQLIQEEGADQAILLLHINQNRRSFAHRCWTGCPDQAEYAYLIKTPEHRHWDATAYVQAHESLHLFGADDLYNLQGGRYYAPRDIMHNYARYIEASVIDSITAFGVGWLGQHPRPTPFPIQQAIAEP